MRQILFVLDADGGFELIIKKKSVLKEWLRNVFYKHQVTDYSLELFFCGEEKILHINKKHLHHNYFTDIITFDLSEETDNTLLGNLCISVNTVRANAITFNATFNHEMCRVLIHGVLHLLGYGDSTKDDQKKMREKEDEYLNELFHVEQGSYFN